MEQLSWSRGAGTASNSRWDSCVLRVCWEEQLFGKHRKWLKPRGPTETFQSNKALLFLLYKLENMYFPECFELLLMERTKSKLLFGGCLMTSAKGAIKFICSLSVLEGWLTFEATRFLFLLLVGLWEAFMLYFRCRTASFWGSAVLFLLNTKDLTKILEGKWGVLDQEDHFGGDVAIAKFLR